MDQVPVVAAPARPIFPPRPIPLSRAFLRRGRLIPTAFYAIAGLVLAGALALAVREAIQINGDRSLWDKGTPAASGKVEGGRSTQNLFIHTYHLHARYVDAAGKEHKGRATFSVVGGPTERSRPEIRYDAQRPDRFVVSWAVTDMAGRWYRLLAILAGGLVATCVLASLGLAFRRKDALLRLCALESDELMLPVLGYQKGARHGQQLSSVAYAIPREGGVKSVVLSFDGYKSTPIYGDPQRRAILALRSRMAPDRPLIVMSDLAGFDLSEQQRQDIDARLRERGVEIVNGRCFPLDSQLR